MTDVSNKFANTVAAATGAKAPKAEIVVLDNAAAMITEFKPEDLIALARTGKFEFAPQMMAIEEGQKVVGVLEGYGPGNEFTDDETGLVRFVNSWIIASPDGAMRMSILSSAQLDKKLPPFIGELVGIARNKDIKISGGHRCADYHVWGPKMEAGKRRQWASLPASSAQPALPPGTIAQPIANGVPREDAAS